MVITGLRLKFDLSNSRNGTVPYVKVYNRQVQTQRQQGIQNVWVEVPLCDAEALFGTSGNLAFEIITDDHRQCPIRLMQLEVFGLSRKEFHFKDKVAKLEKIYNEKHSISVALQETLKANEILTDELLSAKGAPLVAWREKADFLKGKSSKRETIESLDVLTQAFSAGVSIDRMKELVELNKALITKSSTSNS